MREFMQPTYRARLAGINEWSGLSGSVPNNPIAAIQRNNRSGGYNDASKMLH
jgi:ABC-type phosphate transport system substrate-binding protein